VTFLNRLKTVRLVANKPHFIALLLGFLVSVINNFLLVVNMDFCFEISIN